MSDILELLRSDSRHGHLLSLQAAERIEMLEAELVRAKKDCSFWKTVASEETNENRRSNANHG